MLTKVGLLNLPTATHTGLDAFFEGVTDGPARARIDTNSSAIMVYYRA